MKERTKRTLAVILPIAVLSVLISFALIAVINDVYAFVKPNREVTLTISDGSSLKEVSKLLFKNNILSNPEIFSAYVKSKDCEDLFQTFSGEITLNSNMSYREILALFK